MRDYKERNSNEQIYIERKKLQM